MERRKLSKEDIDKVRNIEGFPIGTDEDIIALSDAPFYTACPNPFVEDFITENTGLYDETTDDYHREPFAADVSEGKNDAIYNAHSYHTKVPYKAIMRYILHYTNPGDIVFDGFCGTGMTGVAANLCGSKSEVDALKQKGAKVGVRHSICSDLSPIATLIAASYTLPFDAKEFEYKANAILNQVEAELGWMYETEINGIKTKVNYTIWSDVFICTSCGKEIVLWKESVDLNNNNIKEKFPCPHCGYECSKKNMEKSVLSEKRSS